MTKRELISYFEWFVAEIPERVGILAEAVLPYCPSWIPDYSPGSFVALGAWFGSQVSTRARTHGEKLEISRAFRSPMNVPSRELSDYSFSICFDTGMYLGECFRRRGSHVVWIQSLESKRDVDYGQAVLSGFGSLRMNPVRLMVAQAYEVAENGFDRRNLLELMQYWGDECDR